MCDACLHDAQRVLDALLPAERDAIERMIRDRVNAAVDAYKAKNPRRYKADAEN